MSNSGADLLVKLDDLRLRAALAPLELLRTACRPSLPLGRVVLTFGADVSNPLVADGFPDGARRFLVACEERPQPTEDLY